MTVRELRAALATIEATSEVQVVLFKNDGTSQVFELEEVLSLDGHAQLEIYEAEEAETGHCQLNGDICRSRSRSGTLRSFRGNF